MDYVGDLSYKQVQVSSFIQKIESGTEYIYFLLKSILWLKQSRFDGYYCLRISLVSSLEKQREFFWSRDDLLLWLIEIALTVMEKKF